MNDLDLEKEAQSPVGDLKQVSEMALRLITITAEISELEAEIDAKKADQARIECADLPDLMDSLQLSGIDLPDGSKVTVKSNIRASLPTQTGIDRVPASKPDVKAKMEERLELGLNWIRADGADAMIKNIITADLGKGNDELAASIIKSIEGLGVSARRSQNVHPQTLGSYVREKLEKGVDIPFDVFGVYAGRKAVITHKK